METNKKLYLRINSDSATAGNQYQYQQYQILSLRHSHDGNNTNSRYLKRGMGSTTVYIMLGIVGVAIIFGLWVAWRKHKVDKEMKRIAKEEEQQRKKTSREFIRDSSSRDASTKSNSISRGRTKSPGRYANNNSSSRNNNASSKSPGKYNPARTASKSPGKYNPSRRTASSKSPGKYNPRNSSSSNNNNNNNNNSRGREQQASQRSKSPGKYARRATYHSGDGEYGEMELAGEQGEIDLAAAGGGGGGVARNTNRARSTSRGKYREGGGANRRSRSNSRGRYSGGGGETRRSKSERNLNKK